MASDQTFSSVHCTYWLLFFRWPHASVAANNPAISMSCLFLNWCGIETGSLKINEGELNWLTFLSRKIFRELKSLVTIQKWEDELRSFYLHAARSRINSSPMNRINDLLLSVSIIFLLLIFFCIGVTDLFFALNLPHFQFIFPIAAVMCIGLSWSLCKKYLMIHNSIFFDFSFCISCYLFNFWNHRAKFLWHLMGWTGISSGSNSEDEGRVEFNMDETR